MFIRADSDIWAQGDFVGSHNSVNFAIAPLPEGTTSQAVMNGFLTAININSHNKAEAWEFLTFLASAEGQRFNSQVSGQIPALSAQMQHSSVTRISPHFGLPTFSTLADNATLGFLSTDFRNLSIIIYSEFEQFIFEQQTAQQALQNMQRRVAELN